MYIRQVAIEILSHEAHACYEECLSLYRSLGNGIGESIVLANLGNLVYGQGEYALACTYYADCLLRRRDLGDRRGIAAALDYMGRAVRTEISSPIRPSGRARYEQAVASVRAALSRERFLEAWECGRTLMLEQAAVLTL